MMDCLPDIAKEDDDPHSPIQVVDLAEATSSYRTLGTPHTQHCGAPGADTKQAQYPESSTLITMSC